MVLPDTETPPLMPNAETPRRAILLMVLPWTVTLPIWNVAPAVLPTTRMPSPSAPPVPLTVLPPTNTLPILPTVAGIRMPTLPALRTVLPTADTDTPLPPKMMASSPLRMTRLLAISATPVVLAVTSPSSPRLVTVALPITLLMIDTLTAVPTLTASTSPPSAPIVPLVPMKLPSTTILVVTLPPSRP